VQRLTVVFDKKNP